MAGSERRDGSTPVASPGLSRGTTGRIGGVARELTGDLPCVRCSYNLRGLTIRGMCPECGTSVRTTLLARVDPMASELRPLRAKRFTAFALVAWSACALASAAFVWLLRLSDVASQMSGAPDQMVPVRWAVVVLAALSGGFGLAVVAPHAGIRTRHVVMAALGVAMYAPLCWALYRVHLVIDMRGVPPFVANAPADRERTILRLVIAGLIAAILLLMRPNARLLQARWLLMRIGAVGRQTMLAMIAVVGVWALGDAIRLWADTMHSGASALLARAGEMLILVASLLFTVGLVGMLVDCVRVQPILAQPPLSLESLTKGG